MTPMNSKQIEQAFDRFMPERYLPELPKKTPIDYGDPTCCPYCKEPMVLSKIRTAAGGEEAVYLCREDRAVGCVPDAQEDAAPADESATSVKTITARTYHAAASPFTPDTAVSFVDKGQGYSGTVVKHVKAALGVTAFYVIKCGSDIKMITASKVSREIKAATP